MTYPIKAPRKLIEVALPLDAINEAATQEKSNPFLKGHPRNLHQWWARRPMAAARAVIFSQLVNDPSWKWDLENPSKIPPGHLKASWAASRKRLFRIIEELVQWENTNNEEVHEKARAEILRSWHEVCELNKDHPQAAELFNSDKLPALHDPFAGGGAIPLEAQRLGLETYASDLNPVAVLINKAMIEIPPQFSGHKPVSLAQQRKDGKLDLGLEREWPGATGLAEDVRYYGSWMRAEAEKRIGHLYPPIQITTEMAHERPDLKPLIGQKLTVVAWVWTRTVNSPNPAFSHVQVPLVSTFVLSSKPGKEAYIQPIVEGDHYRFTVKYAGGIDFNSEEFDKAAKGTKAGKAQDFLCLLSGSPISREDIRTLGKAQRLRQRLMAVIAEGPIGRVYLSPDPTHEEIALSVELDPNVAIARESFLSGSTPTRAMITGGVCSAYGLVTWGHLFTSRQLVALMTFSDLVMVCRDKIYQDILSSDVSGNSMNPPLHIPEANAYADAVASIIALAIGKAADYNNSLCTWNPINQNIGHLFTKQAVPMTWDFPETTLLSSGLSFEQIVEGIARTIAMLPSQKAGTAYQCDATSIETSPLRIISTDPPYYDNISYADLSDFFYLWHRRTLKNIHPDLFNTLATPKAEELVATPYRHGSKSEAEKFFMQGMTKALLKLAVAAHPGFPVSIYYAFKQAETKAEGTASTGWITFLDALLGAGFVLSGTWPMRTERASRSTGRDTNALASSIVLVCRKRPVNAPTISRREFLRELNTVLPEALDEMTKGAGDDRSPVAPVDLSQSIIGPGMAVFSKYAAVLEADGTPMSVRTALQLINRFLAEDDFDADTQFCLHWFDQYGWAEGVYGEADVLARAKATSVNGLVESGVARSGGGKVRLLRPHEYPATWDPEKDTRLPIWEALHQLIRAFRQDGDRGAGQLLAAVKTKGEGVRQLAYRLYTLCERRGWAEDARAYNELITSWSGIESAASDVTLLPKQGHLFNG